MRVGPDMRSADGGPRPDMTPQGDASPGSQCPQAWSGSPDALSPRARCQPLDIFDSGSCTAAQGGVICAQTVTCDPPFEDPGSVTACCDGETWVRLEEEPDPCGTPSDVGVPDPIDQGVDAGAPFDCNAVADPRSAVIEDGRCNAVDIFDNATCTPGTQLVCAQTVACDPPFEDPGEVISCCDGGDWVRLEEEPDPCGTPQPDAGLPQADAGIPPDGK